MTEWPPFHSPQRCCSGAPHQSQNRSPCCTGASPSASAFAATLVLETFWHSARTQTENGWVRHSLAVRNQIGEVVALVRRAESGQRGYLLTGHDIYLAPYDNAVMALPESLDRMATIVADNPQQQEAVGALRRLVTESTMNCAPPSRRAKPGTRTRRSRSSTPTKASVSWMRSGDEIVSMQDTRGIRLLVARQESAATLRPPAPDGRRAGVPAHRRRGCAGGIYRTTILRRDHRRLAISCSGKPEPDGTGQPARAGREPASAIQQDAGDRPAYRRRHRPRLNNMLGVIVGSLDLMQRRIKKGDYGIDRFMDACAQGYGSRRHPDQSPACLCAPAAIGAGAGRRQQRADYRHVRSPALDARRAYSHRGRRRRPACGRPMSTPTSLKTQSSISRSTRATPCRKAAS